MRQIETAYILADSRILTRIVKREGPIIACIPASFAVSHPSWFRELFSRFGLQYGLNSRRDEAEFPCHILYDIHRVACQEAMRLGLTARQYAGAGGGTLVHVRVVEY